MPVLGDVASTEALGVVLERSGEHTRSDVARRLWRGACLAACAVAIIQSAAIATLWVDGMKRVRNAETSLLTIEREMSALMLLIGDLQDRQERQQRVNDAVADWMQEASKRK